MPSTFGSLRTTVVSRLTMAYVALGDGAPLCPGPHSENRRNRQRIEIVDRRALARVGGWRRRAIAAEPKWLPWDVWVPSVGGAAAPVGALHLLSDG